MMAPNTETRAYPFPTVANRNMDEARHDGEEDNNIQERVPMRKIFPQHHDVAKESSSFLNCSRSDHPSPNNKTKAEYKDSGNNSNSNCSHNNDNNNENPNNDNKRTHRVRFAARIRVQQIPHLNDTPSELVRATWYNWQDYDVIKKSFLITVRLMMKGFDVVLTSESKIHCTRGLEHRTKKGHRQRQELKVNTVLAVLDEQEKAKRLGLGEDATGQAIAQAYLFAGAVRAQTLALANGLKDERDIQEYLYEKTEVEKEEDDEESTLDWSGTIMEDVNLEDSSPNLECTSSSTTTTASSSTEEHASILTPPIHKALACQA